MKKQKSISMALKILIIFSAILGTVLSAYGGSNVFMGGKTVLMYFTIQSNLAIAMICAVGLCFIYMEREISGVWAVIKLIGTVSITLTGIVFCIVLAPTLGDKAWNLHNTLTHVVVPVASIIDFFVTGAGVDIKRRYVSLVIIPPLL